MDSPDLDDLIRHLLKVGRPRRQYMDVSEREINHLCRESRDIFLQQPNLLQLDGPVTICGDIHGQYSDLLEIFDFGGYPPQSNYLFLGNYSNRRKQSLETICLLLAYKIKYPDNFFLLRGNYECASINRKHGFYDECKERYSVRLWEDFMDCFNCLPVAALVGDKILCVHGGLSPDLNNLNQIRKLKRPTDVPDSGLLCDLLWADPSKDVEGWGMNDRGVSYTFGSDIVAEFIKMHDLDLVCRAHQVVEDGYEFFADRQLVTIFSAPNYRGEDNNGAILNVDETLMCRFHKLKPDTSTTITAEISPSLTQSGDIFRRLARASRSVKTDLNASDYPSSSSSAAEMPTEEDLELDMAIKASLESAAGSSSVNPSPTQASTSGSQSNETPFSITQTRDNNDEDSTDLSTMANNTYSKEDLELDMAIRASINQMEIRSNVPTNSSIIDLTPGNENSAATAEGDEREGNSGSKCVVCLEAPLEGACVPCGHMAGCMPCLNKIKATNLGCPICRAKIDEIIRIYV